MDGYAVTAALAWIYVAGAVVAAIVVLDILLILVIARASRFDDQR